MGEPSGICYCGEEMSGHQWSNHGPVEMMYPDPSEPACTCMGHTFPGVSHIVACCSEPHVETAVLDPEVE